MYLSLPQSGASGNEDSVNSEPVCMLQLLQSNIDIRTPNWTFISGKNGQVNLGSWEEKGAAGQGGYKNGR